MTPLLAIAPGGSIYCDHGDGKHRVLALRAYESRKYGPMVVYRRPHHIDPFHREVKVPTENFLAAFRFMSDGEALFDEQALEARRGAA